MLYPVSSTLIASLGIAGIPYQKWVKFVFPLFMIWCVISIIAIAVAVMIAQGGAAANAAPIAKEVMGTYFQQQENK